MINLQTIDPLALPSVSLHKRSHLPKTACIYFAIDSQGVIQYIGRTVNLQERWLKHHRYKQLAQSKDVRIAYLSIEPDFLPEVELALIEWFNPRLNQTEVIADKKRISLYLDEALKSDLERLAKIRKRSLSNLIEVLCEEELERARNNGELKDA
ncbi:ribbon-helix-helix domain-containing protein [Nostoc sp.]|uniref:ribbon-helix-helix domain-containing protein n=1 Tax=Nostoc sp. TaxID=1180 RepID=UPI002FFBD9C7